MGDHETPYSIGACNKMNCSTVEIRAAVVKSDYMLENPRYLTVPNFGKNLFSGDNQQERLIINNC
jgi:hypothetical protein